MSEPDPARRRFFTLQAVRIGGLALLLAGIVISRGGSALPVAVGYAAVVVGLVLFAVLPLRLARRWRSQAK